VLLKTSTDNFNIHMGLTGMGQDLQETLTLLASRWGAHRDILGYLR